MKRHRQRLLSIFLSLVFFLQAIFSIGGGVLADNPKPQNLPSEEEAVAEDGNVLTQAGEPGSGVEITGKEAGSPLRVDLRVVHVNGQDELDNQTKFDVGESIKAAVDITVSGSGAKIDSPWTMIKVSKAEWIQDLKKIDSKNAYQSLLIEDKDNWYILYKFREFTGGSRFTFPFPFSFKESANDGDTVRVEAAILDASKVSDPENADLKISLANALSCPVLYFAAQTYTAQKVIAKYDGTWLWARYGRLDASQDKTLYHYNVQINNDEQTTSEQGFPLSLVASATIDHTKYTGKYFLERAENLRFTMRLPEGLEPDIEAVKKIRHCVDASFDEEQNILTFQVDTPSVGGAWARRNNLSGSTFDNVPFLAKKMSFNKEYEVTMKCEVSYGGEKRTLPTSSTRFIFHPVVFQSTENLVVSKDNLTGKHDDPFPYYLSEGHYTLVKGRIYDLSGRDMTDPGMTYTLKVSNKNNGSTMMNPEGGKSSKISCISDILLDDDGEEKGLYYKSFTLQRIAFAGWQGITYSEDQQKQRVDDLMTSFDKIPNTLYGVKRDGTEVMLAKNMKYQETVKIDDPAGEYYKLNLKFDQPITLDNTFLEFYTQAFPTQQEQERFYNGEYADWNRYTGSALVYNPSPEDATTKPIARDNRQWGHTYLGPIQPIISFYGAQNKTLTYNVKGSNINLPVNVSANYNISGANWGPWVDKPIQNTKIMILLPPEFHYGNKTSLADYASKNIGEPTVIANYKNTGREALLYSIPDFYPKKEGVPSSGSLMLMPTVTATPYAKNGMNTVDYYLIYENNDVIKPQLPKMGYTDVLDLDEDGDFKEQFMYQTSTIDYIPPAELQVSKQAGMDPQFLTTFATVDMGETFFYNINVFNNTYADCFFASVLDVLPHVGDHSIVADKQGQYPARNSEYPVQLARFLEDLDENNEAMKKFDVTYQLTPQGKDLESVRDGQWLTKEEVLEQHKAASAIKSFRLQLKKGEKIPARTELNVLVPALLPMNPSLLEGALSVGTCALSTDGILYAEANKVNVTFATYQVSGIVFDDRNENGLRDKDENGVANRTVELIDKKTGDVALDENNQPYCVQTDANGKYTFKVYRRGEYSVRFIKRDSDVFIAEQTQDNDVKTINDNVGATEEKTLNPLMKHAVFNAAIHDKGMDIPVIKVWKDSHGKDMAKPPVEEVTVQLVQNGTPMSDKTLTLKAEEDWTGKFEAMERTDAEGKAYAYSIQEVGVNKDGQIRLNGKRFMVSVTGTVEDGFVVINTEKTSRPSVPSDNNENVSSSSTAQSTESSHSSVRPILPENSVPPENPVLPENPVESSASSSIDESKEVAHTPKKTMAPKTGEITLLTTLFSVGIVSIAAYVSLTKRERE